MNVWARELRLPLDPRAAAEAMLTWKAHPIDLGYAGGRYFLLMAGIGFDATITSGIRPEEKRRLGALAYVLRGIELALRIRGTPARLTLDGKYVRGRILMVVVGNTQLYGGIARITARASIDDGLLDVCVMKGDSFVSGLLHALAILRQRHSINPTIEYYRARRVHIIARPALPVQVDGDTIGQTPMTIEVAAGALQALLPQQLPDDLVSRQSGTPGAQAGIQQRFGAWLLRRMQGGKAGAGQS
jgi:YegS/Rv2252/BmrU family lipid kinase